MPGQYDLVYSAAIDDYTLEWFEEFDDRVDNMKEKTDGAFDGLEKGGSKAAIVMGAVGGAVAMITNQLINMAMAGGQAFVGYIKDAAMLSARVDTLGVALEVAGAHAGYSREELNKFEEDVKGMGITTSKARIALQQMAQADLELARAADLARMSQDAAVAAGINSSEAFNRILYAITSLQPEILRNMNIIVNMQSAQEKYAKEIGKTVSQLSVADRQQAMLNATMRAGEDIAGTYEAAMDTAGKKIQSLTRYFEEIQLAIGDAFQPALLAGVDILTGKLKDLTKWLEENEDELEKFGEDLATFVVWLTAMVDKVTNMFTTLPGLIESAGFSMAKALATALEIASPEEMDRRRSLLGDYFAQALTLLVSFAYAGVLSVIEIAKTAAGIIGALFTFLTDDVEGWKQFDAVLDDHAKRMKEVKRRGQDMMLTMSELTGLMDRAGEATEDAGFEFDKAAKDLMNLEEALEIANSRIEDFARSMEDAAAELAIKMSRRATEAALRESWAREDMERNHQARLRAIMEQSSSTKQAVAKRYAKSRIDIERDYQRRIRDLQRNFEFQASELARSRDAVGLLKLMRSHTEALKDADISRKDRLGDAKRAFKEEMKMMSDRIQEQLRRAEEAHRLQLENFERMKAREREIQVLQDKWAEEDRQAQYAKQLAELIIQMGSIEGITQEGLMDLIDLWKRYFGDLTGAATKYMKQLNRVIKPGGQYVPPGTPGYPTVPTPHGGHGVGQGGRVSQMMSVGELSLAERLYSNVAIPPIPKVPASDMRSERKEIIVKVSGEGLEPYIQRLLANGLLEIERNASGG